jgi:hypothetical protein
VVARDSGFASRDRSVVSRGCHVDSSLGSACSVFRC